MNTWKGLFRSHILERGMDYYESGLVSLLEQSEAGYHAVVEGSEDYEVEVEFRDGRVCNINCTCPYAADGNYCKHMAAVLYEIEDRERSFAHQKNLREPEQGGMKELQDLVSKIPENKLREMVIKLAETDETFYNRILTQYGVMGEAQVARLKRQVDEIAYQYSDRSGYIDYRNAPDYIDALETFLCDTVQTMIDKLYLMEAFEITNHVFHEIGNRDMDDADDGIVQIANDCYAFWKDILGLCSEQEEGKMFEWFKTHQDDYVMDFMEDYICDFLMDEFHEESILREKMALIDERIESMGDQTGCGNWYSSYYGQADIFLQRIGLMEELKYTRQEILDFRNKYRHFFSIRKLEIQEYLKKADYSKAIEVLKESLELDGAYPGLVSEYRRQLIDIYDKTGDREAYRAEIARLVFGSEQRNLEYIWKLKEACEDEEWKRYREEILGSRASGQIRFELMEKEGLFQRLFCEIKTCGSISVMNQYEKNLKKHFPEGMRDWYAEYVKKEAGMAADRNRYRELMKVLRKIAFYPDGRQVAEKIAMEWRKEYKRRPAMMQELEMAGF